MKAPVKNRETGKNQYSQKLNKSKSFGLVKYLATILSFLLVEKFNEFFWRECKKIFHCPN
jgi:hypothetical protein